MGGRKPNHNQSWQMKMRPRSSASSSSSSIFSLLPFPSRLSRLALLLGLLLLLQSPLLCRACPFEVQQFCACVDQMDGVLLNCTAEETAEEIATATATAMATERRNLLGQHRTSANSNATMGTGAARLMQTLKASQAHLGLLKLLSIHRTRIPLLTDNFFAGLYIRRLELVDCEVERVENGAFRGLEGVLQELAIVGGRLEEMPSHALQHMNSLFHLDLTNNSIGELKAEHALPRLQKLNDINLSHNRITGVHKTFFDNVKSSLQTINLGHNQLQEMPASALRGFRQLMALHLHNNQLLSLGQLSFMNLPVLSLLNLASNQIETIHRQAFLNAPQLRFLYLSSNRLTEVQPFQFSSFERLEMLDLSNNQLESLQNDSLAGLPALRQLYLGENQIRRIQAQAFSANSSIAVLILEQNQLTELEKDSGFQHLRQLQQLSLKANKLRSIDAAAFQSNPGLVMLDLSHNELMDLAPATFLSQLNLLLVDLSHNRMLRTPFGAFGRRVATVLLQENPLVCVERIHMLQQGSGVFIPNSDDAVCGPKAETDAPATVAAPGGSLSAGIHPIAGGIPSQSQRQRPSETPAAEEEEDSLSATPEELPADNLSAFVQQMEEHQQQQQQQQGNGHGQGPKVKPIRIGVRGRAGNKQTPSSDEENVGGSSSSEPIALTERLAQPNGQPNDGNGMSRAATISTVDSNSNELPAAASTAAPTDSRESSTATEEEASPISTTEDPAESIFKPNVVYPHPVPFLKQAPKMHIAKHIESDENGNPILEATLPPSILVAQNIPPQQQQSGGAAAAGPAQISSFEIGQQEATGDNNHNSNDNHNNELSAAASASADGRHPSQPAAPAIAGASSTEDYGGSGKFEEFPLKNVVMVKEESQQQQHIAEEAEEGQAQMPAEEGELARQGKSARLPAAVIVVCLGTVAAVMCAVFVGLCVARKRQLRQMMGSSEAGHIRLRTTGFGQLGSAGSDNEQHSPNSNSFMSAAVAARAAQLNGGGGGGGYFHPATATAPQGTLQRGGGGQRHRSASGTLNNRCLPPPAAAQDDIYGWFYGHHQQQNGFNAYKK